MSEERAHAVEVLLAGEDDATLLRLVSTLHRRGVRVLEATLSRPDEGPTFGVTFLASEQRAQLVAAALDRLVEVVRVDVSATSGAVPVEAMSVR